MTIREIAHEKAIKLINNPSKITIINVVTEIINCKVDGQPITSSQINQVLSYMEDEVGNLCIINKSFDNAATLSLMGEVRKLIAQAQNAK